MYFEGCSYNQFRIRAYVPENIDMLTILIEHMIIECQQVLTRGLHFIAHRRSTLGEMSHPPAEIEVLIGFSTNSDLSVIT